MGERTHRPVFPGLDEVVERRQALRAALVARRVARGLSQTDVAAQMGTSQSSVARFEGSAGDLRLSTLRGMLEHEGHGQLNHGHPGLVGHGGQLGDDLQLALVGRDRQVVAATATGPGGQSLSRSLVLSLPAPNRPDSQPPASGL